MEHQVTPLRLLLCGLKIDQKLMGCSVLVDLLTLEADYH
jgi:hypothetical protein